MPRRRRHARDPRPNGLEEVVRLGEQAYMVNPGALEGASERAIPAWSVEKQRNCVIRLRRNGAFAEARTTDKASRVSKSIPRVLDFGRSKSHGTYLVVSWSGGARTLEEVINEGLHGEHRTACSAYPAMSELVEVLFRLHHYERIHHGDIKPSNLAVPDDHLELLLIDFGFSWRAEQGMSRRASRRGTAGFAAPELWEGRAAVQVQADQFSTSATFFKMLTGKLPWGGMGGQARQQADRDGHEPEWTDASRWNASIWPSLNAVLRRGLRLDPRERFPTSRAWRDAFDAARPGAADRLQSRLSLPLLTRIRESVFQSQFGSTTT